MAKFYGTIGYAETVETRPSIWQETVVERPYAGDIIRNMRRLDNGESVNDNITLNNSISIVADPYAREHFFAIRYL